MAETKPKQFNLISPLDLASRPHPGWIIKNILPVAELAVIYGLPGSGKTFAVLDMVMSITRGMDWMGHKVRQPKRVIYICAESSANFGGRLLAYSLEHELPLTDFHNLHIIADAPNFLDDKDAESLINLIGPADVIVIDTLARIMPGGDESKSSDMGRVISTCSRIHKSTGATILLVHHAGKDPLRGMRGWSGLLGATDTEILVEKIDDRHSFTITKQKDGKPSDPIGFKLPQIFIGTDTDGGDLTSCVVEVCDLPQTKVKTEKPQPPMEKAIIETFRNFESPFVHSNDLIAAVAMKLPPPEQGKKDQRKPRVRQSLELVLSKEKLAISKDGLIFIP